MKDNGRRRPGRRRNCSLEERTEAGIQNRGDPLQRQGPLAPGSTRVSRHASGEAWPIQEDGLPISSLPPPQEIEMVKKRFPPFHGEDDGIQSWSLREPTGGEERRTMEDADPEDAETALRKSEPKMGSRTVETRCRNEDHL
ncbi:hypothetical protein NDU88_000992 [Pleurodeles waltl]|uniref:Uncharacterized protein n=1 Tax=Pleurodeles waltl TaxID=8319 RepID=A0AAV7WMY8_PLEWA|nr:hypothetical protein NDU88_000992 [Pleurodeles waltl]